MDHHHTISIINESPSFPPPQLPRQESFSYLPHVDSIDIKRSASPNNTTTSISTTSSEKGNWWKFIKRFFRNKEIE